MKKIIWILIIGALVAGGFWTYQFYAENWNIVVDKETHLNGRHKGNQVELDTYVKSITEGTQLGNLKGDKMAMILRDAVSGRYGDKKGELGNRNGQGGSFFSAIVEAYPDIKGQLDVYDLLVTKVFAAKRSSKGSWS